MQRDFPDDPDEGAEHLPIRGDGRRTAALTIARGSQQQALSLSVKTGAEEGDDEEGINFLEYWRVLVKRRWTVLAATAMVLVIALVNTLLTTPIYRAAATVQIEPTSTRVTQIGGAAASLEYDYAADFKQTQMELLKSRALAQKIVSQMGLVESGEMDRLWPGSIWQKLKLAFVSDQPSDKKSRPSVKARNDERTAYDQVNAIAGAFQGGLGVDPVKDSQLVSIRYDSPSADFSQRAANAAVDAFIASNLERRFDSTSYAKGYLEDSLQALKLKLEDSERKLVDFAQKEQIVSSGDTSGANLLEQNLGSMNAAYAKAKEDRIRAEARWQQAPGLVVNEMKRSDKETMIESLRSSRSKMLVEYQDKLKLYKPEYPQMQQLKGQIDEIDKQIKAEETNIRGSFRAEYEAALQEERVLGAQLSGMRTEVLDLQKRSIQYNIFKREVDTNRQLYDALLQRYKEIGVASGVSANNISLVDRAELGYKLLPDMRKDLTKALFAGVMLGVLLAFAFEYLDDTVKRPEDIEKLFGLAVLGAIPMLKAPQTPTKALEDNRSAFSEAYRSLRTALQFSTDRGAPRTLLVTSATPSEGKSTTAWVLGQYYAQLGKRVLIVDCDLRNPSLHRIMNIDNEKGLSNYLAGAEKPADLIRNTPFQGLMYMPAGPLPPNPAELLMGSKMVSLLAVAAEKFDMLIMDGPPIMGLADALILSNLAQGTLVVVHAEKTRIAVIKHAIKRLRDARAHIVGGLLTHFQPQHAGQAYGVGGYAYYSQDVGLRQLARK